MDAGGSSLELTQHVDRAVKLSNEISLLDVGFIRVADAESGAKLNAIAEDVLRSINELLGCIDGQGAGIIDDLDDLKNQWTRIIDTNDLLFEKTVSRPSAFAFSNLYQDVLLGAIKGTSKLPKKTISTPTTAENGQIPRQKLIKRKNRRSDHFLKLAEIEKPQLYFALPVDNSDGLVWRPKLTSKPHSLIPLEQSLVETVADDTVSYLNPYAYEIQQFEFPKSIFTETAPVQPKPLDMEKVTWVDNVQGVADMVAHLRTVTEVAVDVEHHDYRSYYGITCLLQVSTREKDFIIDPLTLREQLQPLNEVLADPNIVKVFHGAHRDVIWLQRDLGLYVVGMFDTFDASQILGRTQHSLASLLEDYCGITADKSYQLADWRLRPLTQDLMEYAITDTHHLLYIYDHLRNALVHQTTAVKPKMALTLERSRNTALKTFRATRYADAANGADGVKAILRGIGRLRIKSALQVDTFQKLHHLRDSIARLEDESPLYVMSTLNLVALAETRPRTADLVLATCSHYQPLIEKHVQDIVDIILSQAASASVSASRPAFGPPAQSSIPIVSTTPASHPNKPVILDTTWQDHTTQQSTLWHNIHSLKSHPTESPQSSLMQQIFNSMTPLVAVPKLKGNIYVTEQDQFAVLQAAQQGGHGMLEDVPTPIVRDPLVGATAEHEFKPRSSPNTSEQFKSLSLRQQQQGRSTPPTTFIMSEITRGTTTQPPSQDPKLLAQPTSATAAPLDDLLPFMQVKRPSTDLSKPSPKQNKKRKAALLKGEAILQKQEEAPFDPFKSQPLHNAIAQPKPKQPRTGQLASYRSRP